MGGMACSVYSQQQSEQDWIKDILFEKRQQELIKRQQEFLKRLKERQEEDNRWDKEHPGR